MCPTEQENRETPSWCLLINDKGVSKEVARQLIQSSEKIAHIKTTISHLLLDTGVNLECNSKLGARLNLRIKGPCVVNTHS